MCLGTGREIVYVGARTRVGAALKESPRRAQGTERRPSRLTFKSWKRKTQMSLEREVGGLGLT